MECKNSSEVVPIDLLREVLHHVCFTYRGCFIVGSSWGSRGGGGGGGCVFAILKINACFSDQGCFAVCCFWGSSGWGGCMLSILKIDLECPKCETLEKLL